MGGAGANGLTIFATKGYGIFYYYYYFLPCLRQILHNMASLSNPSHGHKVSHFSWNFLSLLHAGLESVEGLLVLPDGALNSSVALLLMLVESVFKFKLNKNFKVFFGLDNLI